ncbi:MAG: MoaD/ThiS family protein [Pseudomonadota bacterium]
MKIVINIIGVEIKLNQPISLEPASTALKDVLRALKERDKGELRRFVGDDLEPVDCSVILVNGRNMLSLDRGETQIHDGDEITFMVPVAGG